MLADKTAERYLLREKRMQANLAQAWMFMTDEEKRLWSVINAELEKREIAYRLSYVSIMEKRHISYWFELPPFVRDMQIDDTDIDNAKLVAGSFVKDFVQQKWMGMPRVIDSLSLV